MRSAELFRFLLRLAWFLPLGIALLAVDWACGEAPVRHRVMDDLVATAGALRTGKPVWTTADSREVKTAYLLRMSERKDVLILGSSRLVPIPAEWFKPQSMFNAAVFKGDLDDMVSIVQLCLETGKLPRTVVLEVNPTLVFEGKQDVAPVFAPYFRRALLRYRIFPQRFFLGALSLHDFRWALRFLTPSHWGVADAPVAGTYRMWPDGSCDWNTTRARKTADEVEDSVRTRMHQLDPDFQYWRTNSAPRALDLSLLRAFLDDLQSRRIRVQVLLAPVHPAAYPFYRQQGGYDETWIRREMASRRIPVAGSFCPSALGATRDDFFDDVHVHLPVLHRLLTDAGVIQPNLASSLE